MDKGYIVARKKISRLMKLLGITVIYPKPNTSKSNPAHKVYPYLLRNKIIDKPDQVWCTDITYIPIRRALCIWSPSWTGIHAECYHGGFPTPWM